VEIWKFITTAAVLTLLPGPDIIFVLTQGLTRGRKPALAVSAGLASGLLVHTTAAALGLSLIISRSPAFLQTIKYAGVFYLAYLGAKAFLGRKNAESVPDQPGTDDPAGSADRRSFGAMYRVGVTMNLLNPKVILFFLALFPQFLDTASGTPKADIFLLGGIFSVVAVTIFCGVAVVSGFLSGRFSLDRLSHRTISWVNAGVYWALAIFFLLADI